MITTLDVARLRSAISAQGITQSELAKSSGVSRAQLSRLLASDQARVREGTLKRLARALQIDVVQLAPGGELESFRELVGREHAELDFRGIGMPGLQKLAIEDVFVDLDVREDLDLPEASQRDDDCFPEGPFSPPQQRGPGQPMPATQCIRTHDRVVLLGNPGGGKTTVLRFLAHFRASDDKGDGEIPIYVRLPELCRAQELDERVDPVKYVAAWAAKRGCPNVEQSLNSALEDQTRRCLVLLDGLDEVGSQEQRTFLIERVQEFIGRYPQNRFVISSRVVGFESAPWKRQGFAVFRILPYQRRQLETFAEKWAKILARLENRPHGEVLEILTGAIFSNPRVRTLAANPLILTILVLLNEARGGTLPRRRVDLYEKVVDVFLDTWESSKRETRKFDDTHGLDLDAREFRWLLSDLSLAMQKADRTLAPRWWIAERMQDYLHEKLGFPLEQAKDASDRIIRYLTERTGIIEERGLDLFGFSHRTLQEYFASLGVIDEADASPSRDVTRCLRGYYFHPQWSEVVRLVAAQLTPTPAESLVSSILDDPDPVGRFLHRGQMLALRCLSDGTTIASRRLVSTVFDSIMELGKSRWLGITLEAIDALQSFEGTRFEGQADRTVEVILETARRELSEEEYYCLDGWARGREILESAAEELPPSFIASEAAREVTVMLGDRTHQVFHMNSKLRLEDPKTWYSSVCLLLEDPEQSAELKELLVRELGRTVATDRRARVRLRKILGSDAAAPVRAASASALAACTKGKHNAKRLLLQVLENDREEQVIHACASALTDAAANDAEIRNRLMEILSSGRPPMVRSGAARGLAKATAEPSVLEMLQRFACLDGESDKVRTACAWALESLIGKNPAVTSIFTSWLDAGPSPRLQRIAAQALGAAMADERLGWDRRVVEQVESILMNLEHPCPHALDTLEQLATAREIRRGLRLESVLRDALQPLRDRIELAFVFGSTARNRQTEDSDVDLLILGDVNLKALSGPLREAERTLGRRINPAIYARSSFREKYQAGDPFLLDVYRREKIPVIHPGGNSSHGDLDDELRAMVAERVASTE
ncbi:MAG TPA: HEAT repeat domain-containing protein [Thermoguttaceae bacterium]|nr:HEAT repeat domain-containing protein [Thermoguttaceae bacterium]